MGVPKFYRYISERYPCLSQVIKEHQIPEFDNLYLDMNGIIHPCSHPKDDDPHFRITEEQIFKDIFHYIECLFRIIRPRKVLFLAVDGVAPRAKMNQQRSRRFRSAKESEENDRKARQKGEVLPTEKKFDSNVITPGTGFMCRLNSQLRYFINDKVSRDEAWRGIQVFLSGHETPGEGEHKIMEYIRYQRTLGSHDPRTRHCLYGLDADLIMLGLATHEPNFSLLREEIKFIKDNTKGTSRPEEITFHLLHLSVMRDYIHHEFAAFREALDNQDSRLFEYDLERVIDDWVLMGFLVGNDFVPHLPHMHIRQDHLPVFYETYCKVLPTQGDYLTYRGKINIQIFETFLSALTEHERETFEDSMADARFLRGKRGQMLERGNKPMSAAMDGRGRQRNGLHQDSMEIDGNDDQEELISIDSGEIGTSMGSWNDDTKKEFIEYRNAYYNEKYGRKLTTEFQFEIKTEWLRAMQWIMYYYYLGCQSWGWFFPYHYAPFLSDMVKLDDVNLQFDLGKPFLPFEQLLAVLPAASKSALPPVFYPLMENSDSEIIDFYPKDFATDLNGKTQDWESVVLISFIDENRLREAMKPLLEKLSDEEVARNVHSPAVLIRHDPKKSFVYSSSLPGLFPDLQNCHTTCQDIWPVEWHTSNDQVIFGLLCNINKALRPGFPSLHHVVHECRPEPRGVKVFQQPSRSINFIMYIGSHIPNSPYSNILNSLTITKLCQDMLGKVVAVGWPHTYGAKVIEISSPKDRAFFKATEKKDSKDGTKRTVTVCPNTEKLFNMQVHIVEDAMTERWGIELGHTQWLIHAKPLIGRKLQYTGGKPGEVCIWGEVHQYPLQTCVSDLKTEETRPQINSLSDIFLPNNQVFVLTKQLYGQIATVKHVTENGTISLIIENQTDVIKFNCERNQTKIKWLQGWKMANMVGITSYILSRLTGTLYLFIPGDKVKRNIGLGLRSNRGKGKEACGYTRRCEHQSQSLEWFYSASLQDDVTAYMNEFPEVFEYLYEKLNGHDDSDLQLQAHDIWPEHECKQQLLRLSKFIKELPSCKAPTQECGSKRISREEVDYIIREVENYTPEISVVEKILSPKMLFFGLSGIGRTEPDGKVEFRLWDRVVNCRSDCACPLGWRGTIVGVVPESKESLGVGSSVQSAMCDVVWDKPFIGGSSLDGLCPERRGYRIPQYSLLKLGRYRKKRETSPPKKEQNGRDAAGTSSKTVFKPITSPRGPSINFMERMGKANAAAEEAPRKATGMIKNSSANGPQNFTQNIFKKSALIPSRETKQPDIVNAVLLNGNIRQAQGAMKAQQKGKMNINPSVNNKATQQLKTILNLPPTRPNNQKSWSEMKVPCSATRWPTGPPDITTKGFQLKRLPVAPKLDTYQKVIVEEPRFNVKKFFDQVQGLNGTPITNALTADQVECLPLDEQKEDDLDTIVEPNEEEIREENLEAIQKQLQIALKTNENSADDNNEGKRRPEQTAKAEKPRKRLAINFANAKK